MNLELGKMYKYESDVSNRYIFYFVPIKRIDDDSYICHIYKDLDDGKWNNSTMNFHFNDCYHNISKVDEELSMAIAL